MREIVIDTETTGTFPDHPEPRDRDRIVEVGCIELMGLERTGLEFHAYVNPDRGVPEEVVRVHGLTGDFLSKHRKFGEIAAELLEFIGDAPLVAHNAAFDQSFINAELTRCGLPLPDSNRFVDTLLIARKRFPGASCSLDALAKRFQLDRYGFDLASRKGPGGHGALIDARILAEVYLQLKGGREQRLAFEVMAAVEGAGVAASFEFAKRTPRPHVLPPRVTAAEAEAHAAFVAKLGASALWLKFGT